MTNRPTVRDAAALLLSSRPYSVSGLTKKLLEREYDPEEVAATMASFVELGYLDDHNFAQSVLRHYQGKGYGKRRIQQEMQQRGVDTDTAQEVLENLADPSDVIDALIQDSLRRGPLDEKAQRRLVSKLQRKGFDWSDIREALARIDNDIE